MKNSFPVRSFSWHGRTFHVTHTESQGQGVPPTLFYSSSVPLRHQTNTHYVTTMISGNKCDSFSSSQAACSAPRESMNQIFDISQRVWARAWGQMQRCNQSDFYMPAAMLSLHRIGRWITTKLQNEKKKKAIKDESVFEWKNKRTS